MDKRRRLSAWLQGDGIEIGALHLPLGVPRGARVRYVDRLTVEEQRLQYPELAGARLPPVDVVGSADDLSPFGNSSVDFVIANHLLEHVEDPIGALLEFERVLRPGGVVYLGLPDQRRTFDRERELTSVPHLLRDHEDGVLTSRRDHYVEWARHVVHVQPDDLDDYVESQMSDEYSIHFHCWQPDTFLDFFVAAREKIGLDFQVVAFAPPERDDDFEFIAILAKGRSKGVPLPGKPPSRLRERVLNSRLGPTLGALWRGVKRIGN
ncbi:MAG TPA: class I SAM-dependent methyltransferase [Acidimicrobiia bacterium]